jgi:hypothetical protein
VRENTERRINERTWTRSNGQIVIHPPPLRVACSYLITAWSVAQTIEGELMEVELVEQRLLSQVLQVLSGFPTIPAWFLEGTALDGQEPPLPMVTAQADGIQNPAEFWNAIGNKLRPSLTVTVTISVPPFPPEAPEPVPIVVTRELAFEQPSLSELEHRTFRIGGRITNAAGNPVEGAVISLVGGGRSATTDRGGYYSLGLVAIGDHTLQIRVDTTTQEVPITVPTDSDSAYNVQLS